MVKHRGGYPWLSYRANAQAEPSTLLTSLVAIFGSTLSGLVIGLTLDRLSDLVGASPSSCSLVAARTGMPAEDLP